jgi:hypothetical protein
MGLNNELAVEHRFCLIELAVVTATTWAAVKLVLLLNFIWMRFILRRAQGLAYIFQLKPIYNLTTLEILP